jgi:glycosyltransferase involved in cell wall biosynthesis
VAETVAPSGDRPLRLLAIYTHPVQYDAPLFRTLATSHPGIDFEVLYLTRPTAEQQGQGFGVAFQWDQDLAAGYRCRVFRDAQGGDDYTLWNGLDAPGIAAAVSSARPDVVLMPGWHCRGLLRALWACNRLGIPAIYRGDTNLWLRPGGVKGPVWDLKNRLLLHRFSGFAAVGNRARIFLREYGIPDERIVDSPHAVDGERLRRDAGDAMTPAGRAQVRAQLGVGSADFVVLFAGKLEPRKRPEDAIAAVARLGSGAVLVMCGAGELDRACRARGAEAAVRTVWLGFRNQSEMPRILAAADVLVLPSASDTWGLVVNEAMAVGTPCVVSDAVGCAPDLVQPGRTGEVFPSGDIPSLVEALGRIRGLTGEDRLLSPKVQERARLSSLEAAAGGIATLAAAVAGDGPRPAPGRRQPVLALCDGMVILGGMERRTMEILDYAAAGGSTVHCVFEHRPWRRYRLTHRAEQSGHSWSSTRVTAGLFSGERSLLWALRVMGDVLLSSASIFLTALRRRPRVVFLASFASALRNWPALLALRWMGFAVLLRSGNAPALGIRHQRIWRWLVDSVVGTHVANSQFIASEIVGAGIASQKVRVIRNPLPQGLVHPTSAAKVERRIIYVGQVLPEKGILELLDALFLLQSRSIPFEATLVGRFHGWEHPAHRGHKDSVRDRIARLRSGAVRIQGEREDVLELMATASMHCCPSRERQREGLANVVLQAKVAGIPSVVTPSGALPEMVRHRVDGWVCDGFGPEAIAEGLAYFLQDPSACRQAGAEAAAWRDPAYLRETVARQWQSLLCGQATSDHE